jgi:arabinofuranan 3-O-arabinosyltransferase
VHYNYPLLRLLLRPRVRYRLAWLVVVVSAAVALGYAWTWGRRPGRADGNWGHANIDFGGQWLMGRMLVEGHGRHLYDRNYHRQVLERAYPVERGDPGEPETDVQRLLGWMVGPDDRPGPPVGGPLYPPVHALLYAPLALLPPQPAYRAVQLLNLGLIFLCGGVVRQLTGGRVWWPVATVLLMMFPGFSGAINLGQNSVISLTLLLVGWWQISRGRPVAGGVFWGFLAFKPVWAAALFLVPLLTRRWRVCLAMLLTGVALVLFTLPVVGLQSWFDWLAVGRMASANYARDQNWIFLSRDLIGIPRRWLLHFADRVATDPGRPLPTVLGVGLWLTVMLVTAAVAFRGRHEPAAVAGPPAAFVLLGALLSCYHFIYYDVLLAALPVALLFAEPLPVLKGVGSSRRVVNPLPLVVLVLLIALPYFAGLLDPSFFFPPYDTFCLLVLWAWCGWTWLRTPGKE